MEVLVKVGDNHPAIKFLAQSTIKAATDQWIEREAAHLVAISEFKSHKKRNGKPLSRDAALTRAKRKLQISLSGQWYDGAIVCAKMDGAEWGKRECWPYFRVVQIETRHLSEDKLKDLLDTINNHRLWTPTPLWPAPDLLHPNVGLPHTQGEQDPDLITYGRGRLFLADVGKLPETDFCKANLDSLVIGRPGRSFDVSRKVKHGSSGTHTIRSGVLGDYSMLSSWEANEQADLTGTGPSIADCYHDWATGLDDRLVIVGWTTTASDYIEIRGSSLDGTEGQSKTNGTLATGFLLHSTTQGDYPYGAIEIREDYVRLSDLNVDRSGISSATDARGVLLWDSAGDIIIERCVFKGNGRRNAFNGGFVAYDTDSDTTLYLSNTIIYGGGNCAAYIRLNGTNALAYLYYCTFPQDAWGNYGCYNYDSETYFKNCVATTSITDRSEDYFDFEAANSILREYSVSSDASADDQGGTGNKINQAVIYRDPANEDYRLHSTDTACIGAGENLASDSDYPISIDIERQLRSATPDIGADQYTPAGTTTTTTTTTVTTTTTTTTTPTTTTTVLGTSTTTTTLTTTTTTTVTTTTTSSTTTVTTTTTTTTSTVSTSTTTSTTSTTTTTAGGIHIKDRWEPGKLHNSRDDTSIRLNVLLNHAGDSKLNPIVAGLACQITFAKHSKREVLRHVWIENESGDKVYLDDRAVDSAYEVTVSIVHGTDSWASDPPMRNRIHFTTQWRHVYSDFYVASRPETEVTLDGYDAHDPSKPLIWPF